MKPTPTHLPNGQKGYLHRYGVVTHRPLTDFELEMYCFSRHHKLAMLPGRALPPKYKHFRNIASVALPEIIWNDWLEKQVRSLCDDYYAYKLNDTIWRKVAWAGCGAAGKTYGAAFYASVWFLADPLESIVVLTSTSAKMVRKRIWPEISNFISKFHDTLGEKILGQTLHIVDSKTTVQSLPGNDKHAMFAMAVGEGETTKAAANIQGMHAKRILVVIDEATDTQEAIVTALENLRKACDDFTVLYIGNAKSRLDPLGQAMTPKNGWNSITVEDEEWITTEGLCVHFDGFKSPNVKASKTLFPFIYTFENYKFDLEKDPNSLTFWMYVRGFPPPDGVVNTVLSEALIEARDARGKHTFLSRRKPVAGLDPAFGGDSCKLTFGLVGDIAGSQSDGIQVTEAIEFNGDATSKVPLDYQIARWAMTECVKRGVAPECLGVDSTGIGRGVFAVLLAEFGPVVKVEFGGNASDLPSAAEDNRPGVEVYDRRVTELWWVIKQFVDSGQLKGLTDAAVKQLCARQYTMKAKRYSIETKEDYKSRQRHSPDDADSLAVMCSVVRTLGIAPSSAVAHRQSTTWTAAARKADSVYAPEEEDGADNDLEEPQPQPRHQLFGWMTE